MDTEDLLNRRLEALEASLRRILLALESSGLLTTSSSSVVPKNLRHRSQSLIGVGDVYQIENLTIFAPNYGFSAPVNVIFHKICPGREIPSASVADQLEALLSAMERTADRSDESQRIELSIVAEGARSARVGDEKALLECFKGAGKWTLEVAKSVASELVVAAIKAQAGLS